MSNTDQTSQTSSSLPQHLKSRPAAPLGMLNGHSPLSRSTNANSNSSSSSTKNVLPAEQDKLTSSIRASYERKTPINLNTSGSHYNGSRHELDDDELDEAIVNLKANMLANPSQEVSIQEEPRDARDASYFSQPIGAMTPRSPFTMAPPVDFDGLSWPSIGTRERLEQTPEQAKARLEKLSGAVRTILECIGEDPDREGLHGTPERYAKALMFFTKGYEENVRDLVNNAVFSEDHDELVIVKDIEIFSLCEHHMVPFMGKMHIGYIPNQKVLGLSKFARLAEMFSRRLQIQERLTKQVALAITEVLKPMGVGVIVESSHLCMVGRGVQKTGSTTTTSCMLGIMRRSSKTREEFLALLDRK